jgi:hypothetical protein
VDREDELETLKNAFQSDTAELVVIYGRRRLGKSALVREATDEVENGVYWQATEETPDVQLSDFVDAASETFPLLEDIQRDWEALLRALGRHDAVVVLDEFPYLVQSNDVLPSKVQRVWDMHLEQLDEFSCRLPIPLLVGIDEQRGDRLVGRARPGEVSCQHW